MDVVILSADGMPLRQTGEWSADVAYGDDENRFEISGLPFPLSAGMRWQVDGTPFGGVVDKVCPSAAEDGSSSVSYEGRTFQGVLAGKVVEPPAGQAHRVADGELNACIAELVASVALGGLFSVPASDSGLAVSGFEYRRYCDAYSGLRMLCASAGARPLIRCTGGGVELSAVPADSYGELPSERVAFDAKRDYRPVNHLVGLGPGDGAQRQVCHWYADAEGALSQEQSLFGTDEVAQTEDLSGEEDDLSGKTREKLADLQTQGEADVSVPAGAELDVGDLVSASDAGIGISVSAQITKVILKVDRGTPSLDYEAGEPQWPEEVD